ncbi:MAG: TetR/AcrR family transcriptional regulator [Dehalococcoidia bacterium]|nr:TetR/AcrR family transcriptional regulator [Dehalococcoidia bacterium]
MTIRKNTEIRKKQITDAVREIIARYGSENITIRRLSRAVGISEAAIYRHFKSKREILSFLVEDIEQTWMTEIEQSEIATHPALSAIDIVLRNRISTAEQRGGVSFQVIAEIISLGDKKLNKQAAAVVDRYIGALADLVASGIHDGEIKEDINPVAIATIIFGMIQGLVNNWALNNYNFNLIVRYTPMWNMLHAAMQKTPELALRR